MRVLLNDLRECVHVGAAGAGGNRWGGPCAGARAAYARDASAAKMDVDNLRGATRAAEGEDDERAFGAENEWCELIIPGREEVGRGASENWQRVEGWGQLRCEALRGVAG